ncbi:hypothetical protein NEMIN01_1672 [Nematocida minor]|uniref:uncharacterized protein n=1 Tax=Nematocida minor TaxID=1912983 RepID=UPI00222012E1|nr:uncharacterized protein NEMIN01_1672 [Nematocida minor]KAI5191781.1 hypothetical protein NEMIN01_1672 [Nematocida minor]
MTVLVDTFEVPAHAIMSQLYKTMCYEVMLEEVLGRSYNAPKDGKKYMILEDISPKTLVALRDVEHVIYVFHREILSEREYKMIKYYTNELIYVENNTIRIVNKKTKNQETHAIERSVGACHKITHRIHKMAKDPEKTAKDALLTKKQEHSKEASLPFLRAQAQEDVYFPEEEEMSEDSDLLEEEEL